MCLDNIRQFEGTEKQIVYKLAIMKDGVPVSPFNALSDWLYKPVCKYIPNETVTSQRENKLWTQAEYHKGKIVYGLHFFSGLNDVGKQLRFISEYANEGYIWDGTETDVYVVLRCEVEADDVVAVGEFPIDDYSMVGSLVAMKAKVLDVVSLYSKAGDVSGFTKEFMDKGWMKAKE